jgi:hypothetical protein
VSRARRWVKELISSPTKLVSLVALVAAVLWWQWPVIAGHDSRTDVVLLTDGFLTSAERPVTYRIHEDGHSLRWDSAATSWCDAAQAVRQIEQDLHPAAIVLSFGTASGCDAAAVADAVKAARGHTVLVVAQPGGSAAEDAAGKAGATVIDPSRFVGDQLIATSMPCQWWDTCTADGTVPVRSADGSLTPEGGDRVGRMIVAELP